MNMIVHLEQLIETKGDCYDMPCAHCPIHKILLKQSPDYKGCLKHQAVKIAIKLLNKDPDLFEYLI